MNALETALAQITASGSEATNRRNRIDNDPRIQRLNAIERRLETRITEGGMRGAHQMMVSLTSPANVQIIRARALVQARINQLVGYRPGVLTKLARAAELRRQLVRNTSKRVAA